MDVRVGILGELDVVAGDGRHIHVGGRRQRTLLALLATSPDRVVSTDLVVNALWTPTPPTHEANAVQTVVSRLRRAVGDGCVMTLPPGYVLRVDADNVDASRFERLADDGRRALAAGEAPAAADRLRAALSLWRGPPLAEFIDCDFARFEAMRLEERRLSALEDCFDADMAVGRHRDVVGEIEALATENPLRERLQAQRLLALYLSGRQADALARYRELAELLRESHGLEPGRSLRDLERRMLQQDPALDPSPATRVRSPPADQRPSRARATTRRLVSVVVVDLDDPDASARPASEVDAERRRADQIGLLGGLQAALEGHGGVVERVPGGAVAVFGLELSHEDDAARAVRAGAAALAVIERGTCGCGAVRRRRHRVRRGRRRRGLVPHGGRRQGGAPARSSGSARRDPRRRDDGAARASMPPTTRRMRRPEETSASQHSSTPSLPGERSARRRSSTAKASVLCSPTRSSAQSRRGGRS